MSFKVIFCTIFISFLNNFVIGHLFFEPHTLALNNSLYEAVLNEKLCAQQINVIRKNHLLMLYFTDASINLPKGILEGNTIDMGNYQQCININHPLPGSDLKGKYCVIEVLTDQNLDVPRIRGLPFNNIINISEKEMIKNLTMVYTAYNYNKRMPPNIPVSELQLTLAMCIPEHCTTQEAFDFLLPNVSRLRLNYSDVYCRLPNDRPWAPADYTAIGIFSLLSLVTLVSTSYDLWHKFVKKTDPKAINVVASSFSVFKNGHRLTSFKPGPEKVECIDGIRALSMAWIIIWHTFNSEIYYSNPFDLFSYFLSWQSLWLLSAHYAVDTFFTLSGFLIVYTTVGKLTSGGLLKSLHLFYINRLLRIFPLLATTVLLEGSFLNWMTDGPDWRTIADRVNSCRATWLTTLLHIQNYINPTTMCLPQSWYLAVDIQLHILSPIILVWILMGISKIAWTALAVAFISVSTVSTVYIFINNFPPVSIPIRREHEIRDYYVNYYVNTLTRAAPFIIGMAFGYYVRVSKKKVEGVQLSFFWTLFFGLTTVLMCVNYPINQVAWENQLMTNIYNSFVRSLWAVVVGSLIYACVNGFAGPINWFLSLRMWKIHARLSYAMYLFHSMMITAIDSTAVTPGYFSLTLMIYKFLSYYFSTMAMSFLLTLLVDAPFSTLFKLILGKRKTRQKELSYPLTSYRNSNFISN